MNQFIRGFDAHLHGAARYQQDTRLVPTGAFRFADAWFGHPAWLRAGTSLGPGMLPLFITYADAVCLVRNVVDNGKGDEMVAQLARQQATPANPVAAALLDQARDCGEGLRALTRYVNITHPHLILTCDQLDERVHIVLRGRLPTDTDSFALYTALLAAIAVRYLQRYGAIQPDDLTVSVLRYGATLTDSLGIAVTEDQRGPCRITISPALARRVNPGHDPQLWQIALDRLGDLEQAASRPDIVARLEDVIGQSLARYNRLPSISEAAKTLGQSERTLSRRLGQLDLGFRDIADRVRQRRASQLIMLDALDIADIAHRLGFPDQSSFCRRFKTWFGTTPTRYRRDHRERLSA